MRKSSKVISMLLAVLMVVSSFTAFAVFNVSAADDTKIYFEFPTDGTWGASASVKAKQCYAHIWAIYGNETELEATEWQDKPERLSATDTAGVFAFDTADLGTIEPNADYGVIFSTAANGGYQTCNITFSADCLGDTVVVTGNKIENPMDSTKLAYEAKWKNNSDNYGPMKAITSTGRAVGQYFPAHQPKAQLISNALHDYLLKPVNEPFFTTEANLALCETVGTTAKEVYNQYVSDYAAIIESGEEADYPLIKSGETEPYATVKAVTGTDSKGEAAQIPAPSYVQERLGLSDEDITPTTEPEPTTEPAPEPEFIEQVSISTDSVIAPGEAVPGSQQFGYENVNVIVSNVEWDTTDTTFDYGKEYVLSLEVSTMDGYYVTKDTNVDLLTGEGSVSSASVTTEEDGVVKVEYHFNMPEEPAPAEITRVEVTCDSLVAVGEAIPTSQHFGNPDYYIGLSDVAWDTEDTVFDYDKTYTLTFTVSCGEGYVLTNDTEVEVILPEGSEICGASSVILEGDVIKATFAYPMPEAPVPEVTYVVTGSAALMGEERAWNAEASPAIMEKDGDVYTFTFSEVAAADMVQLKVVELAEGQAPVWHGDHGTESNVEFAVTAPCAVTVTYDPATGEITVTGDNVTAPSIPIDAIRAVGGTIADSPNYLNGIAWDPTAEVNTMEEINDGLYFIYYSDIVENNNLLLKFAANGSWDVNWGGAAGEGEVTETGYHFSGDAVYNGDNLAFDFEDDDDENDTVYDMTIYLDLREFDSATKTGAKFDVYFTKVTPEPTLIETVDITSDDVIAVGQTIPGSQHFGQPYGYVGLYNVAWDTEDTEFEYGKTYVLTFEVRAEYKEYYISDETVVNLTVGEGSEEYVKTQQLISGAHDGFIKAEFTFTMPTEPGFTKGIMGDVNGDGNVDVVDATMIQAYAIGLGEPFNEAQIMLADTNNDNRISILDVTAIQYYAAGKTDKAYLTGTEITVPIV